MPSTIRLRRAQDRRPARDARLRAGRDTEVVSFVPSVEPAGDDRRCGRRELGPILHAWMFAGRRARSFAVSVAPGLATAHGVADNVYRDNAKAAPCILQ